MLLHPAIDTMSLDAKSFADGEYSSMHCSPSLFLKMPPSGASTLMTRHSVDKIRKASSVGVLQARALSQQLVPRQWWILTQHYAQFFKVHRCKCRFEVMSSIKKTWDYHTYPRTPVSHSCSTDFHYQSWQRETNGLRNRTKECIWEHPVFLEKTDKYQVNNVYYYFQYGERQRKHWVDGRRFNRIINSQRTCKDNYNEIENY